MEDVTVVALKRGRSAIILEVCQADAATKRLVTLFAFHNLLVRVGHQVFTRHLGEFFLR